MPGPVPNIWLLQSQGDVEGLSAALRHSDSGARRGAAAALRALGAWQAHAAISAALQHLDHDLHIETMIRNLDVRGLSKMLASSRTEDVITACHALAGLGDRQAVEPLVMVFRSPLAPDPVKLAAAEALLKLESAPGHRHAAWGLAPRELAGASKRCRCAGPTAGDLGTPTLDRNAR